MKELKETVKLMESSDYKERFMAEYFQLEIRMTKLRSMVKNWENLNFTPTCSKKLYIVQLEGMNQYMEVLKKRAELENIKLN